MVQIACALAGLWLIIAGSVPKILFGRSSRPISKRGARKIGLILFSIVPLSFIINLGLAALGPDAQRFEPILQLSLIIIVAIAAISTFRGLAAPRQNVPDVPPPQSGPRPS